MAASEPVRRRPPPPISARRVQPPTHGCLHPGAVFAGTQRNGHHRYSVTVELTNVDMDASHLGGYLTICGLTKEWPELTTYFEAEIIGSEYSFITNKWDATEADDLKHWSRFPEFPPFRQGMDALDTRFDPTQHPVVYMRWKEQFLVPDHRVHTLNGASFAGFYYICVELTDGAIAAQPSDWRHTPHGTLSEDEDAPAPSPPLVRRRGHMRGLYFHENSEPYQELSLDYVPSATTSTMEWR